MKVRSLIASACIALAGVLQAGAATASDVTLKVVSSFPHSSVLNQPLFKMIEEVNAVENGGVKLHFIGGPETLPSGEMLQALSGGIVDFYYGSVGLFVGEIPEALALNGTNQSAMALRESGALELLSESFEERLNSVYVGNLGSGYKFHLYLVRGAQLDANGALDLQGWKLRGGAMYQSFFNRLGVVMIGLFAPDMYSAMERGIIDGFSWASVGVLSEGWEQLIKHRVVPGFWQGDVSLVGNRDKWNSLTDEQRNFLTAMVEKYEVIAHEGYIALAQEEERLLRDAGMTDIVLEGEMLKKYQEMTVDLFWEDLKERIPADKVETLRAAFLKN